MIRFSRLSKGLMGVAAASFVSNALKPGTLTFLGEHSIKGHFATLQKVSNVGKKDTGLPKCKKTRYSDILNLPCSK
jgi:hypothetical protein